MCGLNLKAVGPKFVGCNSATVLLVSNFERVYPGDVAGLPLGADRLIVTVSRDDERRAGEEDTGVARSNEADLFTGEERTTEQLTIALSSEALSSSAVTSLAAEGGHDMGESSSLYQ